MKDKKFLIVGLGLLGGSYAKGLKKHGLFLYGIDIDAGSIRYALENGIIDEGDTEGAAFIGEADVIISGLYPTATVKWVAENHHRFKPGVIITDVGGVKHGIVEAVQDILHDGAEFISCHPMAGKEVSGVRNSDENMFEKANFIITPTAKNTAAGIKFAEELAGLLKFKNIVRLSVDEHDRMIGFVSQLTHVIAVTLMNTKDNTHLVEYTGDSFRDLTRIAKINDSMWGELFMLNKDVLVGEIDAFASELAAFREKLAGGDLEGMKALFRQSTERRRLFDKKSQE